MSEHRPSDGRDLSFAVGRSDQVRIVVPEAATIIVRHLHHPDKRRMTFIAPPGVTFEREMAGVVP